MDTDASDARIRAALARDDPAAAELIWDRYAHDLLAFLAARLCSRPDAEDVLQSLFVRIVRQRRILAQARHLDAYLYRMAANEAVSFLRGRRSAKRAARDNGRWLIVRENQSQQYDLAEQLEVALSRLPRPQREVVVLKVYRAKTFREIARLLGVSVNTAASRYRYGMERLRNLLKDSAS